MTTLTNLKITLLFALLVAGSSLTEPACNTEALALTLTGEMLDHKESETEASFEAFVPESSV